MLIVTHFRFDRPKASFSSIKANVKFQVTFRFKLSNFFRRLYFASLAFFVFWSLGLVLTEPPDVPELRPVENVLPDLLWCRDYFIYYGGTTCVAVKRSHWLVAGWSTFQTLVSPLITSNCRSTWNQQAGPPNKRFLK